jgi:hypothetical protein
MAGPIEHLFSTRKMSNALNFSPVAARDYTAIQRTQVIQVIQVI